MPGRRILVFCGLSLLLLAVSPALAYEQATYLTVAVAGAYGSDSVRTVMELNDFYHIGVMGGKPFELAVQSSYPLEPLAVYLATSEGLLLQSDDWRFPYVCTYLIPYYGMAVAVYPDGRIEGFNFYINPAWHPEQANEIPQEHPELVCPTADDAEVEALIEEWWHDVVVPALDQRKRDESRR